MNQAKEFLKKNRSQNLKIHVLGDAMIDEYHEVKVNRISPEFPMPIMLSPHSKKTRRPGGAANVVHQFKHFNVDPLLFCFYDDKAAKVFEEHHIQWASAPFSGIEAHLPIKRRFLDGGIQIVRHDIESANCGLDEHLLDFVTKHLETVVGNVPKPDVAVLSDYNKGFFASEDHSILDYYRGVTTIVDPKNGPLSKWKGCSILKPNAKEAFDLTGRKTWREQAKHLQNETECESVVITFGGEKVAGVFGDDFFCYHPDKKVEVESVIGAGDCFCAIFAMAIGHGFPVPEAAEIAWNAGSVYVQNKMNRPIVPAELSTSGLIENGEDLERRDFKLAFTNGCFDVLHEGHLQTLRFAKSKVDKLVVALNSDASVKRLKGDSRPLKPLDQRMKVMAALDMVDFVVSFDEDTPYEIINQIKPDVLVKGSDYDKTEIVGADIVPEVLTAPLISDLSTTKFLH